VPNDICLFVNRSLSDGRENCGKNKSFTFWLSFRIIILYNYNVFMFLICNIWLTNKINIVGRLNITLCYSFLGFKKCLDSGKKLWFSFTYWIIRKTIEIPICMIRKKCMVSIFKKIWHCVVFAKYGEVGNQLLRQLVLTPFHNYKNALKIIHFNILLNCDCL